jgi:flagellar protein FlbD
MIRLTKINSAPIVLNSDLIEFIEETPDTVITLTNNDRLVVRESMNEIIGKVVDYRRLISGLTEAEAEHRLRIQGKTKHGENGRGE